MFATAYKPVEQPAGRHRKHAIQSHGKDSPPSACPSTAEALAQLDAWLKGIRGLVTAQVERRDGTDWIVIHHTAKLSQQDRDVIVMRLEWYEVRFQASATT
jgi:hypothetical protein